MEQEFECSLCQDIVFEPVVTPCNHMFCHSCLHPWVEQQGTCPTCRAGLPQDSLSSVQATIPLMWRMLLRVANVTCRSDGCNHVASDYQAMLVHMQTVCPEGSVHCPETESGCDFFGPRKQLEHHLSICRYTLPARQACQHAVDEIRQLVEQQGACAFCSVDEAIATFHELAGPASAEPNIARPYLQTVLDIRNEARGKETAIVECVASLFQEAPENWSTGLEDLITSYSLRSLERKLVRELVENFTRVFTILRSQNERFAAHARDSAFRLQNATAHGAAKATEINSIRTGMHELTVENAHLRQCVTEAEMETKNKEAEVDRLHSVITALQDKLDDATDEHQRAMETAEGHRFSLVHSVRKFLRDFESTVQAQTSLCSSTSSATEGTSSTCVPASSVSFTFSVPSTTESTSSAVLGASHPFVSRESISPAVPASGNSHACCVPSATESTPSSVAASSNRFCFTFIPDASNMQDGSSLEFDDFFNEPLTAHGLPSCLTELKLGYCFNQPLAPDVLPGTLTSLIFGDNFNQPLGRGVLPPSLTLLELPDKYNAAFHAGNTSLTSLVLGPKFNQPLAAGALPPTLMSLTFGYSFNQLLAPGVLPATLVSLTFEDKFNQPLVPGVLPPTLTSLTFGDDFNQALAPSVLPSSLTSLTFNGYSAFDQPLAPGILPSSLTTLNFVYFSKFNQPLAPGVLPSSLTSLTFCGYFNHPLSQGVLPPSLTSLTFYGYFNQPLAVGVLPSALTSLTFSNAFDQPLAPGALPLLLKSLTFGDSFNQPLAPGVLPPFLMSLTFPRSSKFSHPLPPSVVPDGCVVTGR